jgi:hypothetical protein
MPRLPCWLVLVTLFAAAAPARAQAPFRDWTEFFAAFRSWPLDSTRIADVRSLMIERDAGTLVLEEGRLAFAKPFAGRRVAAVFVGRGTFRFAPGTQVEREQLERVYGTKVLRRPFERLTLIVADTTVAELQSGLQFRSDTLGELRGAWRATFPHLLVPRLRDVRPLPLTQMLLDGADNGLFWCMLSDRRGGDPLFFSLVPDDPERVTLEREPSDDRARPGRDTGPEDVCRFFAAGDVDSLRLGMRPVYEAVHYALDVTLTSELKSTLTADVTLVGHGVPRAWIGFLLPDKLIVDDVTMEGRPQRFFRENRNPMLWVRLDRAIAPESTATVRVSYHGDLLRREEDWIVHRYSNAWYPVPWCLGNATWEMTFHSPRELQLVGCGTRTAFREDGLVHHSTWRVVQPTARASFDVNFLRGTRVLVDSLPPITVWMRHVYGAGRVQQATLASLRGAKDYDERVAFDVGRAFQYFRRQLGEPLATEFNAVETPGWVYEGYPGLVHMMLRENKLPSGAEYTPDLIRAHEISHQWFGLSVFPATYHDAWLSEGFAEFCGIWYLQASRKDSRDYFKALDAWREKLTTNRRYIFGTTQEPGPIWLGTRTSSSSTPGDYDIIVYEKGAWVLHMLRTYLFDESDPAETRFRDLMRRFYQDYRGRRVLTEEFRAAVERAAGEDMGWFFRQWVYGTGLPACRFTWKAEPVGAQWRIRCRLERSKVPDTFRFPVFVRADYPGGTSVRRRVWSEGPVTEFELPPAPGKPSSVTFNDLHSVLCEELK